ncbi:MAG: hypothetical protein ABR514_08765 [Chthoniobacterales bacterium]
MIPLASNKLPASREELARAIEDALRRYVTKSGPIVEVRSRVFPYLDEILINLDGARFESAPALPAAIVGDKKPAFEAALIRLSAQNVSIRSVPATIQIVARDVVLQKRDDANGQAVLLPDKIRDGQLIISAAQLDLEQAVANFIDHEAQAHGIMIDQVRLAIRERGPRSLAAEVRVQARKLFLRAKIDIYARVDIDDVFVARLSQLQCRSAGGAIGTRACAILQPHLDRFEGKAFSLKSFPLGNSELQNLRLAVTDTVEVTVDFGS